MNLSRRRFTKALGLVPMVAPLAAKAAADAEIAKLVDIRPGAGPFQLGANNYGGPAAPSGLDDYAKARIAAADYVKHVGLPDFVRESFRRDAQYVSLLDPDIAAKRSWSMSVKILTQRERNLERRIEAMHHGAWQSNASLLFKRLTGWDWPW